VVATWDRRTDRERARLAASAVARWTPLVLTAAPFHAARIADLAGVDGGSVRDLTALRRLPPTRERDLQADHPAGATAVVRPTEAQVKAAAEERVLRSISRAIRRDEVHGKRDALLHEYRPLQLHRGGAAGGLLVASTRTDLDRMHRAGARAAAVLGLRDDDVVVSLVPAGPNLAHLGTVHLAAGAGLTALHARGAGDDVGTALAGAHGVPATVLIVTADDVDATVASIADGAAGLPRLRLVVTLGPPPTEDHRRAVAEAFEAVGAAVSVLALWGPAAGRTLWAECDRGGHGLHTFPDLEVLEVLDPLSGLPTAEDGDLTLTSLGWHGTAHVRFQTGTWVDPLRDGPCPGCGRNVPRIAGPVEPHAWELPARTADGSRTVDLRGVAVAVAGAPWVTSWRAELRAPVAGGPDGLRVDVAGDASDGELATLTAAVTACTGADADVLQLATDADVARAADAAGGVLADLR
jgi:phenylacetate-coenzyme A ligase PaaK-like adenylate-forming protein